MNGSCKCRLPSPQKFSLKFLLFPTQRSLVLAGATYAWPTSPISDLGTRLLRDLLSLSLNGKSVLRNRQFDGFLRRGKWIWKHFYAILLLASSAAQLASDGGDVRRLSHVQLFLKKSHFTGFSISIYTKMMIHNRIKIASKKNLARETNWKLYSSNLKI